MSFIKKLIASGKPLVEAAKTAEDEQKLRDRNVKKWLTHSKKAEVAGSSQGSQPDTKTAAHHEYRAEKWKQVAKARFLRMKSKNRDLA